MGIIFLLLILVIIVLATIIIKQRGSIRTLETQIALDIPSKEMIMNKEPRKIVRVGTQWVMDSDFDDTELEGIYRNRAVMDLGLEIFKHVEIDKNFMPNGIYQYRAIVEIVCK